MTDRAVDVVRASEHLSVEEIRAAFERGLPPARRFQWVEHLGGQAARVENAAN